MWSKSHCRVEIPDLKTRSAVRDSQQAITWDKNIISLWDDVRDPPIHSCIRLSSRICYKSSNQGLPWWLSGKESACQCRTHGFDPWSGKIPYITEQLSPCATIIELVLSSPGAATNEPTCCNYWSPSTLELVIHKRSPCNEKSPLATTREKPAQQGRLHMAKINKSIKKKNLPTINSYNLAKTAAMIDG